MVNNAGFSIVPWVRVPHLASHLLARVAHRLASDWHDRYRIRPVLLETFCESARIRATC